MSTSLRSRMLGAALGLGVSVLALSHAAAAQTPEADEASRLGTVTVTAQKVEENLQDVPISITTVSDEKLTNLKASGADVRFLSARVPSVIAESSFGRTFPRFYIRGFGNTDFDLNASQPISLVYDGVPYESPVLKGFPVFDLEAGDNIVVLPEGIARRLTHRLAGTFKQAERLVEGPDRLAGIITGDDQRRRHA